MIGFRRNIVGSVNVCVVKHVSNSCAYICVCESVSIYRHEHVSFQWRADSKKALKISFLCIWAPKVEELP